MNDNNSTLTNPSWIFGQIVISFSLLTSLPNFHICFFEYFPIASLYHIYFCTDRDLVHLSAHIVAKKTGQTCLSLVLHMLMPEVFPEIVSKYLSKNILSYFSWYIRCVDPTELGSYMSSVACPACPKGGHLLPGHIQVEKERYISRN